MTRWLVLYADGSRFSSCDGAPHEAPRCGVQQVFYYDEATGVSVESSPIGHWVWRSNRWFGCDDQMGFWDYMFNWPEPLACLFGRTLHDEVWEHDIHTIAMEIMRTPKSAWRQRERRP